MAATYINDQWVLEDSLGLGRAGDAVARIALEASPPFTIGVTGKWGCGKTSVMRRAFAALGGQPISQRLQFAEDKPELDSTAKTALDKLHHRHGSRLGILNWPQQLHDIADQSLCIWYSPWQHQDADNPLVPLLQEIRAQYSVKRKFLEKTKQFNRQGGLAALTLIEYLTDAALSVSIGRPVKLASGTTEAVRKAWQQDNPENLLKTSDGQRFHLLFEDAVENLLQDLNPTSVLPDKSAELLETARLIIFIDDLDRCEEKTVVSLLEAIKLYLGTRRCVFILGVDEVAVSEALMRFWKRSEDNNREYLEKLLQASVPVPQPVQAKLQELIKKQLLDHGFPGEAIPILAADMQELLEPNPRKVKNFLNSLCANWQVLRCTEMKTTENSRRLLMFQYLRHNHRPVWRLLEREPLLLQLLQRVLIGNSKEPLAGLAPHLSFDDLRITEEVMSRSFAHVLKHDAEDMKLHRNLSLDVAVDRAIERLDRRRSDQYFVNWVYNGGLAPNDSLPAMYLQMTDDNTIHD